MSRGHDCRVDRAQPLHAIVSMVCIGEEHNEYTGSLCTHSEQQVLNKHFRFEVWDVLNFQCNGY